jgi:signal transduction histidine kinase
LAIIIGPFCLVVCGLIPITYFGIDAFTSTRAYVGGEALWSKAQKEAVLALERYVWSHNEGDYQHYLEALVIPLGDKEARLELEKTHPDMNRATQGFLRGGNHPKDIPGMIHLFRRFRHVSFIDQAIRIWSKGDYYISQLEDSGAQIHREMANGRMTESQRQTYLQHVQNLDSELTPLENAFSATLGEGARWLQTTWMAGTIMSTLTLLALSLGIAFLISHQLCTEIDELRISASRISRGDEDFALSIASKDEIGDLARSFQEMTLQRRHIEQLKNEFYANVVSTNKELEAFSYSVSHDLRAPLRAIDGFSRELQINCQDTLDERGKADLARIRAATERMRQLIDDLLELSRLSRNELKLESIDLSAQAEDIMRRLMIADPDRPVRFENAPHLKALGDLHLIQIAFENLFQNALKFTRSTPEPKIEFGSASTNGTPIYFIRDNGAGFDMAYAGKLFKPFQRLHDSKDFPGTGIGLALVQRIIHRHGGKIWAEAEENKGATFFFTLS